MQGPEWYLPAGQLEHARHSRSLVAVHAVNSEKPAVQFVRQLVHTVSAVALQALDKNLPAGHAVQLAQ